MKSSFTRALIVVRPILSVGMGLSLGLLMAKLSGEDPWHVLKVLIHSAVGTPYDFGMTLFYSIPLIFTGLSVAIAFHSGLFNIGSEGQLTMGAISAAWVGIVFRDIPAPFSILLVGFVAVVVGAIWGVIPGWLRAKHGSHEVINTIMMNFIAAGLSSWIALHFLRNPEAQSAETDFISSHYLIASYPFFEGAPVSVLLFFALFCIFLFWLFLWRTVLGYEVRAVGQNELAAQTAGIDTAKRQILAMALAGGFSGLVGFCEVCSNAGKFKIGFSPGYGFMGIAVALLGRNRPLGVIAAALLFGLLHKGASDLDLETEHITRDLSLILQALVILCVSAERPWRFVRKKVGALWF